jgi:ceramide glucosyltransferase
LFLAVVTVGTWALFQQLKIPLLSSSNKVPSLLGVSILKPLKGADADLASNLESFFQIRTEIPFELLFSLESKKDPAFSVLSRLLKLYPKIPAKVFVLDESQTPALNVKNPKLRNVNKSFEQAKYDAVLISDSNVRLKTGELEALALELDEKTGIVTAIVSGTEFKGIGGALESVFLGTFYARFMALSNRFAKPCVVGKAMLFRKSDSERFGGLKLLSEFLAEDFMAGESMRKLGLQVKTSHVVVSQILGTYSYKTFWGRHVRWGRIRKSHAPLAFFAEPLFGTLPMSLLGAFAISSLISLGFGSAFLCSWVYLCILDGLCYVRTTECSLRFTLCFPIFWTMRESLAIPLWIKIASGNDIDWRGNRFTLAPGGLLGDK